jgi:photolyase PhrII
VGHRWSAWVESLPPHLAERCRWRSVPHPEWDGPFILYWTHNALRTDENPALDVARHLAVQSDRPLLVYQGLTERYRHASDRHHAFILQGAADLQQQYEAQQIAFALHVAYPESRGSYLKQLTEQAALVITEDMPVEPTLSWTERLRRLGAPLLLVDTACVVPMQLVGKAFDRAFAFRDATRSLFAARVDRDWPTDAPKAEPYRGPLPFPSQCLKRMDLATLISRCEIDHSVAPVGDTIGGSVAGYARWDAFKADGLKHYGSRRNDAAIDGVSRMSSYLHYGMVSPMRLAREANRLGAEKYLDELLVWRELAHNFCFHHEDNQSFDALPTWARKTLLEHAYDPREADHSWEQLARARVGDPLWDLCQSSLLIHGELHNNVRMTWGKAIARWASSPQRALQLTIDLNDRYALDGRDPSSYGGILWCYGLFDRPFPRPLPVYGQVRARPSEEHQERIDLPGFRRRVLRPIASTVPRVAIVGAGIAGLLAARTLRDHLIEVDIFDRSPRVGGRTASRVVDEGIQFDHGAQYFTARDHRFQKMTQSWLHEGVVAPWTAPIVQLHAGKIVADKSNTPRFVGQPSMRAIATHLAADLCVRGGHRVTSIQRSDRQWWLTSESSGQTAARREHGPYEIVVLAAPPNQAAALVPEDQPIRKIALDVPMRPCWAVLLSMASPIDVPYGGAFVDQSPLSWIAFDSSKPLRPCNGQSWVLHSNADWSQQHIDDAPEAIASQLTDAFAEAIGRPLPAIAQVAVHRWRAAIPPKPLPQRYLWDLDAGIAMIGDWCGGPRVEGAALSGISLAGAILRHVTIGKK